MRAISYQDKVERAVFHEDHGKLIVAAVLYREVLKEIPEFTYYKALERMVERGKLIRLAKGIYIRPEITLGKKEIMQEIVRYYTEANEEGFSGFMTGGCLLRKYGILSGQETECIVYTTRILQKRRKVQNIVLVRYPSVLSKEQMNCAEFLEMAALYEDYAKKDDFDIQRYLSYVQTFAEGYDDASMRWGLSQKDYPKHTIAFVEQLLREEGCKTSIAELLPGKSKYKLPKIETA